MEWWVLLIIFWAVFGCGRGCSRAIRGRRSDRQLRAASSRHGGRGSGRIRRAYRDPAGLQSREPLAVSPTGGSAAPETPFEKLQRDFVEGAITVEEYERGLDRMDPKQIP